MRKYIIGILIALLAVVTGLSTYQYYKEHNLRIDYEYAINNIKAQNRTLNQDCIALQLRIDEFQYFTDSTIHELDSMRRELKIKDDKIKQLSRTKQKVFIHDTLTLFDTIFQNDVCVDTCIGDEWYETCLSLNYPNNIEICNSVNLKTDCFLYITRETVRPPCKTWIGRLFQKKHNVYNVKLIEHNPYATLQENKLIIIQN